METGPNDMESGVDSSGVISPEAGTSIDVSIVVPCFNEEQFISATLDCVREACEECGISYEVLVIDDASGDKTFEVAESYRLRFPKMPLKVKRNEKNRGLSRTFCDGAFLGRGKHYRLVCGDNSESKNSLKKVFELRDKADIVVPYHPTVPGKSALRRMISLTYTALINAITGYRLKYYNGCPLFYRFDVMRWGSYSFGFGFQADLLTRLLDEGRTYIEVPLEVYHHENDARASAFRVRNILSVSHTLMELFIRRLRRVSYDVPAPAAAPQQAGPSSTASVESRQAFAGEQRPGEQRGSL